MKVGVLALQGAFREHREALDALGVEAVEVRVPEALDTVDALVLSGGESTTVGKLLVTSGLLNPLCERLHDDMPALATCAGLIVLAREVLDGRTDQEPLGVIDATVRRNGYGTQLQSFEADLDVDGMAGGPFRGVFIRAPLIEAVGDRVEVLGSHEEHAVLLRDGRVWASTFHPELSGDLRIHQMFLERGFVEREVA